MSRRLVDGKMPVPTKKSPGRPKILELTPEIMEKICQPLRIGSQIDTAFALQNISYATMRTWVVKGHEQPDSIYGALLSKIKKSIAEWETRDLAAWDRAIVGAPAQYEMEVVKDHKGRIVLDDKGKPLMQIARDGDGNPIVKMPAVEPDWRAAAERLKRRRPRFWADPDAALDDQAMKYEQEQKKPEEREAKSFEERVAEAVRKFEEEY